MQQGESQTEWRGTALHRDTALLGTCTAPLLWGTAVEGVPPSTKAIGECPTVCPHADKVMLGCSSYSLSATPRDTHQLSTFHVSLAFIRHPKYAPSSHIPASHLWLNGFGVPHSLSQPQRAAPPPVMHRSIPRDATAALGTQGRVEAL